MGTLEVVAMATQTAFQTEAVTVVRPMVTAGEEATEGEEQVLAVQVATRCRI